jgi:hypothetical protein
MTFPVSEILLKMFFLKTENQKTGKMRHLKCSTNKKVRLHTHGCCSSQISILKIYHKTTPDFLKLAIDSL